MFSRTIPSVLRAEWSHLSVFIDDTIVYVLAISLYYSFFIILMFMLSLKQASCCVLWERIIPSV